MNLKQWAKAKKKILTLGKLGVHSPDKLSLAYLRLYLQTNKMELAWNNWLKLQDDMIREHALRQLIHHATKVGDYKFLLKQESELKSIFRYWRAWEDEMELIYAYLYLSFGNI